MDDDIQYLRAEHGFYKRGAHGFIYRWSNFLSEWRHSSFTPEKFDEERREIHEKRKSD